MKYFSFLVLCIFTSIFSQAQQITVLNKETGEPIPSVAIYNKSKSSSTITDFDGVANLYAFRSGERIYFQHLSYHEFSVIKTEINSSIITLEPLSYGLEEVVISASKFKQSKRDIPQKIVNISANSIQFANPQTSADLLEQSGQVYIQKSQLGGGSPMIRGFSTNRLLLAVDGVRMNNAIFRGGNLQNVISIDPFSIENTEVTLGAGSIIYGSDAIGGVMSFYTKTPRLSYSDSLKFHANATVRYASASNEKTGHLDFNIGLKNWAFLTNASFTSFDDLRMGKHGPDDYLRPEYVVTNNGEDVIVQNSNPRVQRFSGYDQMNFMQKARFEPKENLSFDFGLYYSATSDFPRYDRLIRYKGDQLRSAEWNYGPQKWFMANAGFTKLSSRAILYDKIKFVSAFQNFKESRIDRNFQSSSQRNKEESVNAYSANLDFEKQISAKTEMFYGVEYVLNKVNSEAYTKDIHANETSSILTRYPDDSYWQSAAVYTSLKYKPNSKFVLQSGLRYNYVSYKADFTENNVYLNLPFDTTKSSTGAVTGTAGISWLPNKTMQWKLNASTAFRAPNIDDVGKVFDSEPGAVVVPNENLKPEYAYNGELGLKLDFSNKIILDLASYYTYLDNALVRRDFTLNGESEIMYNNELSQVQAIQNASKAWIYGFEIGMKANLTEKLQLTSQYNIIGGTEEENNIEVPVRHIAPNFGNTHFIWQNKKVKLDAFAEYNKELSFADLAPSEKDKDYMYALDSNGNPYSPSWYTLNFRAQIQLLKSTTLSASLENITDQRYKTYSSGIASPGRNFILSLNYSI
ncbi:hemoglobin/transferrin/lactoferrin receptor protein [Oceanihabitans sediminis]|uniref:TonB-dependent receptor n=1 Tax=Oceanihabitans sediminis TaxID=1812012 RepID=A0A368PB70_9FLAO|nr:TonB-dependent receptor [Oceanihabitans sediminis]RBP34816.1 hemoglobin/transferrin/lactoferrin receptor protein [Oceanihabitans sediminis]RCU58461.1 TonB-dependent receptor [Oceanihabitans sediminis]